VRLAAAKENSGLLNRPFTVHAAAAMASPNATTRGLQTGVWFAWVRAGSGQNFITDTREENRKQTGALDSLFKDGNHFCRSLGNYPLAA
jgi:hypothetical protein